MLIPAHHGESSLFTLGPGSDCSSLAGPFTRHGRSNLRSRLEMRFTPVRVVPIRQLPSLVSCCETTMCCSAMRCKSANSWWLKPAKVAKFNCHARRWRVGRTRLVIFIAIASTIDAKGMSPHTSAMPSGACDTTCSIWRPRSFAPSARWTRKTCEVGSIEAQLKRLTSPARLLIPA